MRGQRFAAEISTMPVVYDYGTRRPFHLLGDPTAPVQMGRSRGDRFAPLVGADAPADKFHTIPDREAGWQMVKKAMVDLQSDMDAAKVTDSKNTTWQVFVDFPINGWKSRLAQWKAFEADQELGRKNNYTGDGTSTTPGSAPWAMQYAAAATGNPGPWNQAWTDYGTWLANIADLRRLARAAGIPLHSPEPPTAADLPSTMRITEVPGAIVDAAKAAAKAAKDKLGDVGKYALIGGGILGGILLLDLVKR